MQFFNFNFKIICMQKCVQLNCIQQSVLFMILLFASSIKMIGIANPFYFNLSSFSC